MVATEWLGLANCQAIVSPKSGGAHAARVPRSISSTILFLLLGGGGAAGLVKLAGDRGGLQPGEMAQGYPDINGEGVSPAAQMAASDEDASSINDEDICATTTWPRAMHLFGQTVDAGLNEPAPPRTIHASVLVLLISPHADGPIILVRALIVLPPPGRGDARARCMPQSARFASSNINDKDQDIINDARTRAGILPGCPHVPCASRFTRILVRGHAELAHGLYVHA